MSDPRFVCGVPQCLDGKVVDEGPPITTVECDTHNARTTHDTVPRDVAPLQVINVRDRWAQHGVNPRR